MKSTFVKLVFIWVLTFASFSVMFALSGDAPVIQSVSVINAQGHIRITWEPLDSATDSIEIQREYVVIARIKYENIDSWVDELAPANTEVCLYQLRSKTIGGNWSSAASDDPIQSMRLFNNVVYEACEKSNTLQWIEYDHNRPAESYIIEYSIDGGINWNSSSPILPSNLPVIGQVNHTHFISQSLKIFEYVHQNLIFNQTYTYRIKAIVPTFGDAYSNFVSQSTPPYPVPIPPQINFITVNNNQHVEVHAQVNTQNSIRTSLWQSNNALFGNPINLAASTTFPYTLTGLDPSLSSVYVQLALIDQCDQAIMANAIHRSIHLSYLLEPNGNISLNWNPYEGWGSTAGQKVIKTIGTTTTEEILLSSVMNYADNISSSADPTAAIEYRLMAFHADGRESYSNTVLYQPEFEPLMPNAFRPRSLIIENTVFNPVIPLTNSKTYRLRIFDRWGGVIFETLDPLDGWNGKRKNDELWPQGVYVYSIEYENAIGVPQVKRGNVMLLH